MTDGEAAVSGSIADGGPPIRPSRFGMSARLFLLTVAFVVLAEVLIYVPAVTNFRRNWIVDRVSAARVAVLALDVVPGATLPKDFERRLLDSAGVESIAVGSGDSRRVITTPSAPTDVPDELDLGARTWFSSLHGAWRTLVSPAHAPMRVIAPAGDGLERLEVVFDEWPLRQAMLAYSMQLLISSLLIATAAASLVFVVLKHFILRPMRRLAQSITAFADDPERTDKVLQPSLRRDEVGQAEVALARMQLLLRGELRQRRRLAELGLSVSKINHELRNLLTTAQLLGDRLDGIVDPLAQRVAPRLVATLDRAIRFCEATLAYGKATEAHPRRRQVPVAPMLAELADLSSLASQRRVSVLCEADPDLTVDADPEQLSRALANLVRNAVQALDGPSMEIDGPCVRIEARRKGDRLIILVADNGPGLPQRAKAQPFAPFQTSARIGGTGLGLAIASELVELNGGTLSIDEMAKGTRFRIVIPDRTMAAKAA